MSWKEPVYIAKVVGQKGRCGAGHKVGDTFELNTHKTSGICGWCYHDLFPTLCTLAFGGNIPWQDSKEFKYDCPDRENPVTFVIRRREG